MKTACQWMLILLNLVGFINMLYVDVNGRKAKAPEGFYGVLGTIIATTFVALLFWGAGAFSALWL